MLRIINFIFWAAYFLDVYNKMSYQLVSRYISWTSDLWYSVLFIILTGLSQLFLQYSRGTVQWGMVTPDGVRLVKDNVLIPMQNIEKIVAEQKEGIAAIHTAEGDTEVRLSGREIVKFAEAGFKQWSIDGETASISRGMEGTNLCTVYKPTGKYAGSSFVFWMVMAACLGVILLVLLEIVAVGSLFIPFILFLFLLGFNHYKEVEVKIEENRIELIDENLVENYIAFNEVNKIEKGLLRTRITAKDGRMLLLPLTLYLLPEFIEEYAELRKG